MKVRPSVRSVVLRYGIAVLAALASLGLRLLLQPLIGTGIPYITFFPAIIVTAWLGGIGPGVVATSLSAVTVWYVLLPPHYSYKLVTTADAFGLVLFAICATATVWLAAGWREKNARLRDSEQRLRLALRASGAGTWDGFLDSGQVYWSDEMWGIYGFGPETKPGLESWLAGVHPDDRDRARSEFHRQMHSGDEIEFEFRTLRDGEVRWLSTTGRVTERRGDAPLRLTGITQDVTERRRAEQALRDSELIYRTIGETIDYGVWICDAEGRNTYVSDSFLKLVGLTREQAAEFGWGGALHPDERESTLAAWKDCVKREATWDREHRYLGVDGRYHHILARGAPVRDSNGRIVCWAGINLDISGLRATQAERERLYQSLHEKAEELSRTNAELEEFAFVASHDLQEPLRTVNTYTQLLVRKAQPELAGELSVFADYIRTGISRMETLIRDLLGYSRTVHAESACSVVDSNDALDRALAVLTPQVEEAGAVIDREPLPPVRCEDVQMSLLFQNLLSNAIKYRRDGVPLRVGISARIDGEFAEFAVRDNGIGFSPEYNERIFGLFKRLHRDQYPGTGLGLAICKRIVEKFGGRISASGEPGVGACFTFALPHAGEPAEALAHDASQENS